MYPYVCFRSASAGHCRGASSGQVYLIFDLTLYTLVNTYDTDHGAVPKRLRERSAKPLFTGSSPVGASYQKAGMSRLTWFQAQVVELVDTRDLKSLEPCAREGSSPSLGK